MPVSREGFKQFLQDRNHTNNTINSYVSGINQASHHGGQNVWEIADVEVLQQVIAKFDHGGAHEEIGLRGNNVVINALKRWSEYAASLAIEKAPKTYLLTWNPANAEEGGSDNVVVGSSIQWSCHSSQPQLGETVYIMRVGLNPKGIVAKGKVSQTSFVAPYWADTNKTWRYLKIDIDEVRKTCSDGLIPLLLLERFNVKHNKPFRWTPITSGVEVPDVLCADLDTQWQSSAGVHSLRQFIEWTQQDAKESRPKWCDQYTARINEAKQYQNGTKPLDNAFLDWLWREGENGVCSVAPGFLPNAAFTANTELLKTLTTDIMQSPDPAMHSSIKQRWQQAVKDGLFEKNYHSVINRVFATFAPEQFNTLVNSQHAKQVLNSLKDEFKLDLVPKSDWPAQQAQLKQCLEQAGVIAGKVIENNIALWQLYEALESRRNKRSTDTDTENLPLTHTGEANMQTVPLNQIFFGPPGTGKTYVTIDAAVKAADPEFFWEDRIDLKARYDQLVNAGRIRFVTFHQSYSYEDFVEGLAANSTDGKISYEKKLGVFRKLVNAARDYRTTEVRKASDSFTDCWQAFIKQFDESPNGVAIKTKRSQFVVTEVEDNTIRFDKNQGNSVHTLAHSTLQAVFDGQREVHGGLQPYYDALIAHIRELGQQLSATEVVRQNYVLVIDEINRGNISRIFGELITLIEPSKRIGAPEALEVTLPLTGDKFGVPDNLYIIGTMNTADRSLAGLDLALRRRFTFVEMPPQPELLDDVDVEGVNIGAMLRVINQRITALLDRDHCIGHAYFMPLRDNSSLQLLANIFAQNILPLLQEYFFEDWQRIAWVLNDQSKENDDLKFIRKVKGLDGQILFPKVQNFKMRDCWEINHNALMKPAAYHLIYPENYYKTEPAE